MLQGECVSNGVLVLDRGRSGAGGWRGRTAAAWAAADVVAWMGGLLIAGQAGAGGFGLTGAGGHLVVVCTVTGAAAVTAGLVCGLYSGRFQPESGAELSTVLASAALTAICLEVADWFRLPVLGGGPAVAAIAALAMITVRATVAAVRRRPKRPAQAAVKMIVFGAGQAGTQLVHRLVGQHGARYQPVALLDDDPGKSRLRICGVPVRGGRERLAEVAAQTGATVMTIAIAGGCADRRKRIGELVALAESTGLIAKVIPPVHELVSGSARIESVRDPRIAHLLGREPIRLDLTSVADHFVGRRILVTGAGGSIGSELCRQLHRMRPASLVMLDRDESALHAIQLALHGRALLDSDETVLADIRDLARIHEVFAHVRPEIVFHAAAVKHLPLLERYPAEALKTNVIGTLNVLQAAADCGVRSFVNISTDKAADPVSVLGTSKRIAERLTADMADQAPGTWVSVRFGNVLGSRGSLLESLSAQIAAGGPVTVTHPKVARYFMTATEAVQLVLQAAAVGQSGEVLILDMGKQVPIVDLARRLAGSQVEIVFTGLRPGEKLTEDLLGAGEPDHRPRHPLVSHATVPSLQSGAVAGIAHLTDPDEVRTTLARLATATCSAPGSASEELTALPAQSALPGRAETG